MGAGEDALVEVRGQLGEVSSSYSVGSGDWTLSLGLVASAFIHWANLLACKQNLNLNHLASPSSVPLAVPLKTKSSFSELLLLLFST